MSIVKNFLSRVIGQGKEQPKKLLSGTDGNLFHTLILTYIRIYSQNYDAKTGASSSSNKPKKDKSSRTSRKSSRNKPPSETHDDEEEEPQDPTVVLLSILTIMPKITHEKLEDECFSNDLLEFLKIICHQFTNNILTIDDQERIHFYEPHLQTPDSYHLQCANKGILCLQFMT